MLSALSLNSNAVLVCRSPVGRGVITCISIYCGPTVDFGNGPRLWVDNLGGAQGTLDLFKDYLQDPEIKKVILIVCGYVFCSASSHSQVFHNYAFDYHMFANHNIYIQGFAADTMHMARLWNSCMDKLILTHTLTDAHNSANAHGRWRRLQSGGAVPRAAGPDAREEEHEGALLAAQNEGGRHRGQSVDCARHRQAAGAPHSATRSS